MRFVPRTVTSSSHAPGSARNTTRGVTMRIVRPVVRLSVCAAAALVITFIHPAAYATTQPGFSTQPRVAQHPPVGSPTLVGLRAGRHPGYDRVVFQLDGPLPSYYSVRYVPQVRLDGSGERLRLRGAAFLEVVVRAPTHDQDYRPVLTPTRLRPDFPALREVNAPGSFEGQTTAGIGVTQQVGFRVLELTNPTRIVIDLAHPPTDVVIGKGVGLVVSPSSGPVGTKVTVVGSNCNNPGSTATSTLLVFQNGPGGTVGAVGLGEIPNDDQGRFRTTVTIPARMDPLQGIGGGPTRPGTYQVTTRSPVCDATFTVTSSPASPAGPQGALPFTGSHTPLLLAVGGGLVAAGTVLLLVRRRARPGRLGDKLA
jgi:LPXTG-motif cell wall-anchored protein